MPTEMSIRELYRLTATSTTEYEKDQIEYVQLGFVLTDLVRMFHLLH